MKEFYPKYDATSNNERPCQTLRFSVVTDDATLCLECPTKADIAAGLSANLFIERDLVGGASRVVILRRR